MAKRRGSWVPSFLRHRNLIGAEAVLIVGALNQVVGERVSDLAIDNALKVLFTMASTLGLFGGLMLLTTLTRRAVSGTHKAVQAVPLPTPLLFMHVAAFAGIFALYAWVFHLPVAGVGAVATHSALRH